MAKRSNPYFFGVHPSGSSRVMNTELLEQREKYHEKTAIGESLHDCEVARPAEDKVVWAVFAD
eukprot:12884469-Prorocentrum_lima.AAC.1